MLETKVCRKRDCMFGGKEQPITSFHKDCTRPDGYCNWCRTCKIAYNKKRYLAKTEHIKEVCYRYIREHKAHYAELQRKKNQANPEKNRANCRRYYRENIDKIRMKKRFEYQTMRELINARRREIRKLTKEGLYHPIKRTKVY